MQLVLVCIRATSADVTGKLCVCARVFACTSRVGHSKSSIRSRSTAIKLQSPKQLNRTGFYLRLVLESIYSTSNRGCFKADLVGPHGITGKTRVELAVVDETNCRGRSSSGIACVCCAMIFFWGGDGVKCVGSDGVGLATVIASSARGGVYGLVSMGVQGYDVGVCRWRPCIRDR